MQEGPPPHSSPGGPRFYTGRPTYSINSSGQARPIEPRATTPIFPQSRQESPPPPEEIEPDPSGLLRRVWDSLSSPNQGREVISRHSAFSAYSQELERSAVFARALVRFAVSSALVTLAHLRLRVIQDDFAEEPRAELLSVLSTLQQLYLDAYLAYRSFQQEYSAALRRYAYGHGLPRYWHLR